MFDPFLVISRVVSLVFVPLMLIVPLVFTLFFKTRDESVAGRARIAWLSLALWVATGVALAFWLGMLLAANQTGNPTLLLLARFSWLGFFPLWFGLAAPLVMRKNPALAGAMGGATGSIRTARLVNRTRTNPIRAWHWTLLGLVHCAGLVAIVLRGLVLSFESDQEQTRWLIFVAAFVGQSVLVVLALPWGIQLVLSESEPMDASGNPDLAAMYDQFRTAKILGLFWLLAIAQPIFFGVLFSFMAWGVHPYWGIGLGSLGGTLIGIAGAIVGTRMSLWRARIAEFKAGLDANAPLGEQTAL